MSCTGLPPGASRRESSFSALLFACLISLALAPSAWAESLYKVEQLGVLIEGSERVVRGMNEHEESVGGTGLDDAQLGFVLSRAGIQMIEGIPGTDYSVARDINSHGEIVGSANIESGVRAFRFSPKTGATDLGTLPGDCCSEALGINHRGQAAGYSSGITGIRAVLWSPAGAIQPLLALPESKSSKGFAINNRGDVAGVSVTLSGQRATLWTSESVLDLGTLPTHRTSEALGMNNRGQVVGSSGDPNVDRHAVFWDKGGAIRDLGTLPGGATSRALGINDRGVVVGGSHSLAGNHAFVWTHEKGMLDLNGLATAPPGIVLTEAVAINPRGVILAYGQPEGHAHENDAHDHTEIDEVPIPVFLLTPVR